MSRNVTEIPKYNPSEWLSSVVARNCNPYLPQIEDEVVYIKLGILSYQCKQVA